MQILKDSPQSISTAVYVLKSGGVIVFPTDTAYALGGVFNSKKVIQRILKIKNRKDTKFPLVASSLHQVEKFFRLNAAQKKLAKKYWPGPLSIVVSDRFAIRVPDNKTARLLARKVAMPIIATSANIAGEKTPYSTKVISQQFVKKKSNSQIPNSKFQIPDVILDAGKLPAKKSSTIVKVGASGIVEVIRKGAIVVH